MRTKTSNQTLLFSALLAILLITPISHAQAQDDVVTNSIGMKFKPMPNGKFTMGVYEVTQEQYMKVFLGLKNPSRFKDKKQNPVEMVSWYDAVDFCEALSDLPAEKKAGHVYRLPTEEEWEYACRAGTKTKYSFGDDASKLGEFAWYTENSGYSTHPVGQKKPNPWGLYDMHGNVYEWVGGKHGSLSMDQRERREADLEEKDLSREEIEPWYEDSRGGSWDDTAEFNTGSSETSDSNEPESRSRFQGFRVARVSSSQASK